MHLSRLAVATATVVIVSGLGVGMSSPAHAAKPEPLAVQITAPGASALSPGQYSFTVNSALRQIASVSVTLDGLDIQAPALQAASTKVTQGSGSFTTINGQHTLEVTVTSKKGDTATDTRVFESLAQKSVDVEGARLWCSEFGGVWEEGQDYFLGTNFEGTIEYWAYNAVWACLQADTVWTITTGQTYAQEIITNYCSEFPMQNPYLTLSSGFDPSKDPDRDNFICHRLALA